MHGRTSRRQQGLLWVLRQNFVVGWIVAVSLTLTTVSCGYRDISSENGRLSLIQQANQLLNSGMCDQALNVMNPLMQSPQVDNEAKLTYASAYACKAEFSMLSVVGNLRAGSSDIYSLLVSAMYSNGGDAHLANYRNAAVYVRQTASVPTSFQASLRPEEANVYMIFMQAGALASVLSVLGNATRSTGKKTNAISGAAATADQQCAVQVAYATMNNCLNNLSNPGVFSSLQTVVAASCTGAQCSNLDPGFCATDAVTQGYGSNMIDAINLGWSF